MQVLLACDTERGDPRRREDGGGRVRGWQGAKGQISYAQVFDSNGDPKAGTDPRVQGGDAVA